LGQRRSAFDLCYSRHYANSIDSSDDIDTSASAAAPSHVPTIRHGAPFTDRKSKFQAHLAEVHSKEDVQLVLDQLYKSKKIATATHNIYTYRISASAAVGGVVRTGLDLIVGVVTDRMAWC